MPSAGLFLARLREAADALHIANNAGEVIDVLAVALRTFVEVAFVNVSAVVADSVGDIEGEIVTTFLSRYAEQLAVLCLREMLLQVGVQS